MAAGGGNIVGQAYIEVLPITIGFQQKLNQQLQRVQTGGGLTVPIGANTTHLQQSVQNALPKQGYTMRISGNTQPLTDAVTTAVSSLARKAMMIVGIGSIFGMVVGHLKDAIYGFNNIVQQAQIGLETILGDADKAAEIIDKLKVFARTTPFQFQDLVKNTQTLIAMGTAADDVIPTLTAVGDTLSALGRMNQLPRVIYDLGQIRATGKLTGRELMNMGMQGIPVLKYIADATGVSITEIREKMALGTRSAKGLAIDSETAIHAILVGMEKDFGGLMQRQMGTAAGAISNWKDAEQQLIGAVGKPLFDKIISSTVGLSNIIGKMAVAFQDAGKKGKSGLTAVKDVFVNLFPKSAQSTINSVMENLGKVIGNLGKIMKTVVETTKQWGGTIGGLLVKSLQALLIVLAPLTDFIAKHKTIVQDLVKVYIGLKIIEVVGAMWTKSLLVLDQTINKTLNYTQVTKLSSKAIQENTRLIQAQRTAMADAALAANGGVRRGAAMFATPNARDISPISNQMPIPLDAAGEGARTASGRFNALAKSLFSTQGGAFAAMVGLTALKGAIDDTNVGATALMTVGQGLATGLMISPTPIGAGLGLIAGAFMAIKGSMDKATASAKAWKSAIDSATQVEYTAYKAHLESVYGTGAQFAGAKIEDAVGKADKATAEHDAAVGALDKYKADHPDPYGDGGGFGSVNSVKRGLGKVGKWAVGDFVDGPDPDYKPENDPEYMKLKTIEEQTRYRKEQLDKDVSLVGEYGVVLQHYLDIVAGNIIPRPPQESQSVLDQILGKTPEIYIGPTDPYKAHKDALTRMGQTKEDQALIFKDDGTMRTLDELEHLTGGTDAAARMQAFLNENLIATTDDLDQYILGLKDVEISISKAISKTEEFAKQQKNLYQIDHDVADANLSLQDTFQGFVDGIANKQTSVSDFVKNGKGLYKDMQDAGAAAQESVLVKGGTDAEGKRAFLETQSQIIASFVGLMQSANLSQTQIDEVLDKLGLLKQYNEIKVTLSIDTAAALLNLKNFVKAMPLNQQKLWSGELFAAYGDIYSGHNTGGVVVPKGDDMPPPTVDLKGGGSSGPSAEEIAATAAKALESASKSFYDTIVQSATDFHDKVMEFMGNPAERLQFTQARSVGALIRNTDFRAAAITDWTAGLAKLRSEGLSQTVIDAMGLMKGPEMDRQVKRLLQASPTEIAKLNASITNEAQAAQKAAYAEQGTIIAKAITQALAKFFADAGTTPGGPGAIEIVNNITQSNMDYDALALRIITQLGGNVKI